MMCLRSVLHTNLVRSRDTSIIQIVEYKLCFDSCIAGNTSYSYLATLIYSCHMRSRTSEADITWIRTITIIEISLSIFGYIKLGTCTIGKEKLWQSRLLKFIFIIISFYIYMNYPSGIVLGVNRVHLTAIVRICQAIRRNKHIRNPQHIIIVVVVMWVACVGGIVSRNGTMTINPEAVALRGYIVVLVSGKYREVLLTLNAVEAHTSCTQFARVINRPKVIRIQRIFLWVARLHYEIYILTSVKVRNIYLGTTLQTYKTILLVNNNLSCSSCELQSLGREDSLMPYLQL